MYLLDSPAFLNPIYKEPRIVLKIKEKCKLLAYAGNTGPKKQCRSGTGKAGIAPPAVENLDQHPGISYLCFSRFDEFPLVESRWLEDE